LNALSAVRVRWDYAILSRNMKPNLMRTIVCGLMTVPMVIQAMPTKAELDKVSPVVADLMKPEQDALKAGKKTRMERLMISMQGEECGSTRKIAGLWRKFPLQPPLFEQF